MVVMTHPEGAGTLVVTGLGKRYGANEALVDVSVGLAPGRIYGLVGVNGSGKSTFLKILAGVERPTSGNMTLDGIPYAPRGVIHAGRLGVGLVPQELPVVPAITVADNLLLGRWPTRWGVIRRRAARVVARRALAALAPEIDVRSEIRNLPLGLRQLVVIGRTVLREPRLVLLDEPTSALTGTEVLRLRDAARRLADAGRTVVIVSQRIDDIFALCDEAIVLRDGRLVDTPRVSSLTPTALVDLILHGPEGGRPSARQGEKSRLVDGVLPPTTETETPVVDLVDFEVLGRTDALTLRGSPGEIIGLAGLPQSGASDLMRSLFGLLPAAAKAVSISGSGYVPSTPANAIRHGLALVSGDRQAEGLVPDLSSVANACMVHNRRPWRGPVGLRRTRSEAAALLKAVRVQPADPDMPVRSLSGGNQQKVIFVRWLLARPKVWLLDDATRGVDVGARHDIHQLVRDQVRQDRSVALVVSSDLQELLEFCDRIAVFRSGRMVAAGTAAELSLHDLEAAVLGTVGADQSQAPAAQATTSGRR